ncbi:CHAT domain-containing protein [Streptomyces sp. SP17BM10]|uniref:CHAT domain-containing protein n=1 Tax=Streptomyces sp. SP17BM10 TaxID=3002530 RepID=UPI002E76071A|nr:CHAT domain-containing protein [Streptomyces sp. SP17BM10]MEE1782953.1 CHAT domain-containing protein [Streptomyces sp. SP17BM10]
MSEGEDPVTLLTAQALREAAELAEVGGPDEDLRVAHLLGTFHWYRYQLLPEGEDQEAFGEAVRFLYPVYRSHPEVVPDALRALFAQAGTPNARRLAAIESALATARALFVSYQRSRSLPRLDEAIALVREAAADTPHDDPDYPGRLSNLALMLRAKSEHTDDTGPLAEAVELGRQAVDAASNDRADLPKYLAMLGLALRALYERTHDAGALAEAADVGRRAVTAAPIGHPDHRSCLSNLCITLRFQAGSLQDAELFGEAVEVGRRAVTGGRPGTSERVAHLVNLGLALEETSRFTGEGALLAEAVPVCREAVASAPHDHPYHADVVRLVSAVLESLCVVSQAADLLGLRGTGLQESFERTGGSGPLADAVEVARLAVAAMPHGHPRRAGLAALLGTSLQELFKRTRGPGLLAEAVESCREAVAATPDGSPDLASYLVGLAAALSAHAEQTADRRLLAEAVEVGRRAVAATPDASPERVTRKSNFGLALRMSARRTRDIGQLTEAVEVSRQVVAEAADGDPFLPSYLSNLSLALLALFEETGDTAPLVEAAAAGRRAVLASPAEHPHRAGHLSYLATVLLALATRTDDVELLVEAMDVGSQAVAALPEDHPDRAGYVNNLSAVLRVSTPEMRARALDLSREAVAGTPHDSPYYARRVSNLGALLQEHAEQTGDQGLLAEAVEAGRRAVAAVPEDHPHHASFLNNLGYALQALAEQAKDPMLSAEALERFRSAGRNTTAEALVRVRALREVAVLAGATPSGSAVALAAMETAVGLLPRLSPRTLARHDQRHQVGRLGSLASVAAAAALDAGRPERAVELLEATRGTLAAGTIDTRGDDLTRLGEQHEGLAREFRDLRDRLDALDDPALVPGADIVLARRLAHEEWERLVERIRELDGFEGFLHPPRLVDLIGKGDSGPIVYLTAGPGRCDALVLDGTQPDTVRTVRLDELTAHDAAARAEQLANARRAATDSDLSPRTRKDAQREILDILAWLWDTVAGPVMTAIGADGTPDDGAPLQRIWWCPVGVMCDLPIHAAGHHRDLDSADPLLVSNPRTVLDRAVSSYTPTARALNYARSHPSAATERALIIAVPDAPGTKPLYGARFEADTVHALIPDALRPDHPARSDVLAALPTYPVAHFSCHGLADARDPAASRLILHDHETAPLTVSDISALRLTGSLAFLSACDTSATTLRLADEAVHLTGAFHLAGYRHVIGTLWPVDERSAAEVAADFYARLTAGGTTSPDTAESARALHHAVHSLRARFLLSPTHWAAHTHTGP